MQCVPEALRVLRHAHELSQRRPSRRARWTGALVGSLLILGVIAGCGGGSGSGSGSDPAATTSATTAAKPTRSISLSKFVTAADQICERGDREKGEGLEAATGGKGLDVTQIEGEHLIIQVVLPIYTEVNEELAALPVPEGHESEIESIIAGVRAGIVKSESEPLLALQGKAFLAPDEVITKLGMTGCIF